MHFALLVSDGWSVYSFLLLPKTAPLIDSNPTCPPTTHGLCTGQTTAPAHAKHLRIPAHRFVDIDSKHDMKLSAMRLSTRMKTERVCSGHAGSLHWLYLSCKMSLLDRLICTKMRWKSSSGGSCQVSLSAASFAWLSSCVQSCIAISMREERVRCASAAATAAECVLLLLAVADGPLRPASKAFVSAIRLRASLYMPCR